MLHSTARPGGKWIERGGMKDPEKVKSFLTAIQSVTEKHWDHLGTTMHKQALKHFGSQSKRGNDRFDAADRSEAFGPTAIPAGGYSRKHPAS